MRFPSWLVWYKKPEYRDIKEYSSAISSGRRAFSPDGRSKVAVPSRLRLERILENKTCSPMSLYDFYMYLKYIEFSSENLEFYVWFRNYEMAYAKMALSVESSEKETDSIESSPPESPITAPHPLDKLPSVNVSQMSWDPEIGQDTLAHIAQLISINVALCSTVGERKPSSAVAGKDSDSTRSGISWGGPAASSLTGGPCAAGSRPEGIMATPRRDSVAAGLFTSNLGHSAELRAVVKTYLIPGADKELNIPASMRNAVLRALHQHQSSSSSQDPPHPDLLRPVAEHAYQLLKSCSHRNFVRLGVSNGTYETVCVATTLGIIMTLAGFLYELMRALWPGVGHHTRWDAVGAWPLWWIGMSLILSGLRGSCFFLLLFSRRQPLPWERFDDDNVTIPAGATDNSGDGTGAQQKKRTRRNPVLRVLGRLMIFDRKLKVKDEHLRRLQFKIVVQSLISGAAFAAAGVLIFIFLPVWSQTVHHL